MNTGTASILVVDLDDTLLRTDLLWEAIAEVARHRPLLLLLVPLVALGGRPRLKRWLATKVQLDWDALPLNDEVLAFVRAAKAQGRTVILATAAAQPWATAIAERLGCFDGVIGTSHTNLSGSAKLEHLRRYLNGAPFDYIGDRSVDIPLWRAAERAYIVGDASRYERRLGKSFAGSFPRPTARLRDWLSLLRIPQWSKNLLVLVPIALAHRLSDGSALLHAVLAAVLLSIVASALYIFNDVVDLPNDRIHPHKRQRPLARGAISLQSAWIVLLLGLVGAMITASALLPQEAFALLAVYGVGSAAYSLLLKRIALVDVLVLAGLYVLRLALGGAATHTELSPWLLGFALLFFTSLALLKRHTEAMHLRATNASSKQQRPYTERDEPFLLAMGIGTAMAAVVILILYLASDRVRTLYTHPDALWLILPLLLWWLMRMWRSSVRGELGGDPVSVALRDPSSLAVGAIIAAIVLVLAR
jgi:4-hydroxybenzoate polyprenyltransferase/phosphoserine phosphatase